MFRVNTMFSRFSRLLIVTGLLSVGATSMAEDTISIEGSGVSQINIDTSAAVNGLIDIYQVGTGEVNKIGITNPITQDGSNHTVRIGQGATYANGVWAPGSAVSNNTANISQRGATGDTAEIYQETSSNRASISQSGSNQTATVIQRLSSGNSVAITQGGLSASEATIIQNGAVASTLIATQAASSAYTLIVSQGQAGGHSATLETTSGYNGAGLTVNQTGSTNTANVSGMSGGSASISQSGTGGNVTLVDQSSGALSISQQGTNNALSITNYGAGASSGQALSVTQTGITAYNPTLPLSGPTYNPSP
jgi:hypothetical protein